MILQALARYYDILLEDTESDIAPPGYSVAKVSFALNLSANGELLNLIPLHVPVQRGKKTFEQPRPMVVPEQVKRSSGIAPNFLCDNSAYVVGIAAKGDEEYSRQRFEAFRQLNRQILAMASGREAAAVLAFLESYTPEKGKEHPAIIRHLEKLLEGGSLVFKLDGMDGFIHEAREIRRAWEVYRTGSANHYQSQCLVTGKISPIARLHPNLKGIRDTNTSGASLVGFNARSYESYNRTEGQGLNAPVSEQAAFAYTTALNYLLAADQKNKKIYVGDTTVVYWAESSSNAYAETFASLFAPQEVEPPAGGSEGTPGRDRKAEQSLKEVASKIRSAQALDAENLMKGLDPETKFYVLGLAPNVSRTSVRFFHSDPFYKIVDKLMAHYRDLAIIKQFENQPTYLTLWQILDETVSKKAADPKASPLMAGALLRAILNDQPYPAALYYAIINRIRADMDDKTRRIEKINYTRAAIIKAFLLRKVRRQPQHAFLEVLQMSLNEQSTIPAYVLGRLFAVLEKAQIEAVKPEATIKDRYFTSACASPASVFPVLLRLSQHHIAKAEYGYTSDRRIQEILNLLDVEKNPIPAHLTLDEQGVFVLGYYHQRAEFYKAKNNQSNEATSGEA